MTTRAPTPNAPANDPAAWIRPLAEGDGEIGGKAASLARLAALGLQVPPGFAVGGALFRAWLAVAPPPPVRLASAADLAGLDATRAALERAPFPAGFDRQLSAALEAFDAGASGSIGDRDPNDGGTLFSVRSSAPGEEQAGTLAAGVFLSLLRVPRSDVPAAIRQVLASALGPAAWAYRPAPAGAIAVLVHPFIAGTAAGSVAAVDPDERPEAPRIDVVHGQLGATARATIAAAARRAAAHHGPIELEWVADGDAVTFLQLRGYQAAPGATPAREPRPNSGPSEAAPDWAWDAAHNPSPLSPAQAGLVALVDDRCRTGIRQRVIDGYLFFQRERPAPPARQPIAPGAARAAFERLRATVEARLAALGETPPLEDALDLFVAAYQPLFGDVQPAARAARAALAALLDRHLPAADAKRVLPRLLVGAPSAATRRLAAAARIATAADPEARQAAIAGYLDDFGDESARWDVAAPTLREVPEPLALFAAGTGATAGKPGPADASSAAGAAQTARDVRDRLQPEERPRFDLLLADAREAAAVGEDDDALYARLQATVRRALLALGTSLAASDRIAAAADVFFLPLPMARAAAAGEARAGDLDAAVAAGRAAAEAARAAPPPLDAAAGAHTQSQAGGGGGAGRLRGIAAAGGRAVGRAVHHPSAVPLAGDAILIAATLLPTELPLLAPAALVVETGSALGHVAAQARERGLPAVVGAAGARAAIPEGALVAVDGDRGEAIVLPG